MAQECLKIGLNRLVGIVDPADIIQIGAPEVLPEEIAFHRTCSPAVVSARWCTKWRNTGIGTVPRSQTLMPVPGSPLMSARLSMRELRCSSRLMAT